MISIENIREYIELEEIEKDDETRTSNARLADGSVHFSNVFFNYSREQPYILRGVTFDVNDGDKIGVIGRTGDGKSTLFNAILRTNDLQPDEGLITIGGLNTNRLTLESLRSQITVIPVINRLIIERLFNL